MSDLTFMPRIQPMDVMPAWLPEAVFGTTTAAASTRRPVSATVTAEAPSEPDLETTTANEVVRLRDDICGADGLTRIELARALNVDRRSLSGWASGEIRPTPDRLADLRFVARVVDDVRTMHRGRVRDLMVAEGPHGSVIDALANGKLREPSSWRLFGPGLGRRAAAVVTAHKRTERPLHAVALAAYLAGELVAPARSTIVRDPSIYEIEPGEAGVLYAEEPITRPRRRPFL